MHYVVLNEVLTSAECAKFIARANHLGFKQAEVAFSTGPALAKMIRNNDRIAFNDDLLASQLWVFVKDAVASFPIADKALGLNPNFRFYRYSPGQRFKPHKDGIINIDAERETRITVLFYLNEDFSGGQTVLMPLGIPADQMSSRIVIAPKAGSVLLFEHQTWHEGSEVLSGTKYVLRSDVIFEKK